MTDLQNPAPYRVLARKYRPRHLDELMGQDALVRTLKNAITSGRLAQAYMLTGVRGVGKTTTARIIARAINYAGPDGKAGPTVGPTDDCPIAQAIAEGRHPDVIEIDAASHSGVDKMRDLIDGVRYAATGARYKVYIIDEVHMLSTAAFNALLKTLEEPPAHVKFIFATTEIRKVPMTILSRCQRFDLRRFDTPELVRLFQHVLAQENVAAEEDALLMIARAAGGSARDGLSILDQGIALAQGPVTGAIVRDMLGLVDAQRVTDMLAAALAGKTAESLAILSDLEKLGADPVVVMEDLLDLTHQLTRARVTGESDDLNGTAQTLLGEVTLPLLSRAWQILLKSHGELHAAPNPMMVAEMSLIRLGYASTLPDPTKLMKTLSEEGSMAPAPRGAGMPLSPSTARAPEPVAQTMAAPQTMPQDMGAIVAVLEAAGHMILAAQAARFIRPIAVQAGRLEFAPVPDLPPKLPGDLGAALTQILGARWIVAMGVGAGDATVSEQRAAAEAAKRAAIENDPMVRGVLLAFPGAKISD